MKMFLYLLIFLISLNFASAYDQIIEYDMNTDILYSTTVYNRTPLPCTNCECNLSLYNPSPNESIIKFSTNMSNKGNGIYTADLTDQIEYNNKIYPLTVVCLDSLGFSGGENRVGIKVGETLFNFTSLVIGLLAVGGFLMFSSFKLDESKRDIKLLLFLSSFIFYIGSVFTALEIAKNAPQSANLIIIFDVMFVVILSVFLVIIYLYFLHHKLRDVITGN